MSGIDASSILPTSVAILPCATMQREKEMEGKDAKTSGLSALHVLCDSSFHLREGSETIALISFNKPHSSGGIGTVECTVSSLRERAGHSKECSGWVPSRGK